MLRSLGGRWLEVDDSSYVKANFLRDIVKGQVSTPLISKVDAAGGLRA